MFKGISSFEFLILILIIGLLSAIVLTYRSSTTPCTTMYKEARSHADTLVIDGMHPSGQNSYACIQYRL